MDISDNYNFELPNYNDPADVLPIVKNFIKTDAEMARQKKTDEALERDKLDVSDFNTHKTTVELDHPDNSVTDKKIGNRSIGTTNALLSSLLASIGSAIKAISGAQTWNDAPDATLKQAKQHFDNQDNPHKVSAHQTGAYTQAETDDKDKAIINTLTTNKALFDTHNADNVRHLSTAERNVWNDKYTKAEVDNKLSSLETNIDWKEAVNTFQDIAKTYPTPQDGWTVNTKDTDYTYRYSGTAWIAISANAIPKATTTVDGLQTKENVSAVNANTAARHTHTNKTVIDVITDTLINSWNTVSQKLSLTGGTLTGFLTLHSNPTANMHAVTKKYVDDSISGFGGGDMLKNVYDTNNSGIVDNAEKVNGHTLGCDVPANAKFTDTVYIHPSDATSRHVTDAQIQGWNAKAAKGDTGATGPQGATGATGAKGADGLTTKINICGVIKTQVAGTITIVPADITAREIEEILF